MIVNILTSLLSKKFYIIKLFRVDGQLFERNVVKIFDLQQEGRYTNNTKATGLIKRWLKFFEIYKVGMT